MGFSFFSFQNLVSLASVKILEKNSKTLNHSKPALLDRSSTYSTDAIQRSSLPDIPLTPRERQILEQTSQSVIQRHSGHHSISSESILHDDIPPPKPPLPNRLLYYYWKSDFWSWSLIFIIGYNLYVFVNNKPPTCCVVCNIEYILGSVILDCSNINSWIFFLCLVFFHISLVSGLGSVFCNLINYCMGICSLRKCDIANSFIHFDQINPYFSSAILNNPFLYTEICFA